MIDVIARALNEPRKAIVTAIVILIVVVDFQSALLSWTVEGLMAAVLLWFLWRPSAAKPEQKTE